MDLRPEDERRRKGVAIGLCLGLAVGAGRGLMLDNLALGIAIGMGSGLAIGAGLGACGNENNDEGNRSDD